MHASNMNTAITRPSRLKTEQGGGEKNRRKDLQLFQRDGVEICKRGQSQLPKYWRFSFPSTEHCEWCLEGGGERGSVGISGFSFHHETLAREILIVDPCGQDLEILPSQSFLVPECSWNWPWLPLSHLGALSKFVPSARQQRDAPWLWG